MTTLLYLLCAPLLIIVALVIWAFIEIQVEDYLNEREER